MDVYVYGLRYTKLFLQNLAHVFLNSYIYTLSPAVLEHMDPFFVEVDVLDFQLEKLVKISHNIIIIVQMQM